MNPETSRSSAASSHEPSPKTGRNSLADQDIGTKDNGPGPDPQTPPIAGGAQSPPQGRLRHK